MSSSVRQRTGKTAAEAPKNESRQQTYRVESVGNAGWGTFCGSLLVAVIAVPLLVLLIVAIAAPSPINPVYFELGDQPEPSSELLRSNVLEDAELLYKDKLLGPESIILHKGDIYTGTWDGKILRIEKGKEVQVVAKLGTPPCGGVEFEHHCGRPLGMRFDADGYLIVADAYLGLFKVNVATGDVHTLFLSSTLIEGQRSTFLNDLDIASDGTIYVTDSSATWQRRQFMLLALEGSADGRLIKYNPKDNSTQVLLKNLAFANGVQLSREEDYLLIAETIRARVLKYHLVGNSSGLVEVFADNLPGFPDNIRLSRRGGYWLGSGMIRWAGTFSFIDFLAPRPFLRGLISKIPLPLLMSAKPSAAIVMRLDEEGSLVEVMEDANGNRLHDLSEVEDDAGLLYLGSFAAPYIARIDTRKPLKTKSPAN